MLLDNIGIALTALKSNKLRSFLTMLGIVIGISAVIAIMIVGDAVNASMMESFNSLGANNANFYVTMKERSEEAFENYREMKPKDKINEEMLTDINEHFAGRLDGIMLSNSIGNADLSVRSKTTTASVVGINAATLSSKDAKILAGRALNAEDFSKAAKTALISDKSAKKLYGSNFDAAVGKPIEATIGNKLFTYTVVGVYEYQQSPYSYYYGSDSTEFYIPLRTSFGQTNSDILFDSFSLKTAEGEDQNALISEIQTYVNNRYYKSNDFYNLEGDGMQSYIDESKESLNKIKLAIAAIAAISLIVGGIGVMNIMIVSITERTREIGTRKALGAENSSIRAQFITEAIVICLIGGLIGILLGNGLGAVASKMLIQKAGTASIKAVAGCVLFSAAFGIFFGYYPANKAAKLNPIDALRYE